MPTTPGGEIDEGVLKTLGTATETKITKPVRGLPMRPSMVNSQEATLGLCKPATVKNSLERGPTTEMKSDNENEIELPPKIGFHGQRWFRHKALSAYRKLFIMVFSINLIAFIAMLVNSPSEGLKVNDIATAVAANLFASVLFR
ncbi:hypothetical protein J7T55_000243, partial [Diaporthe amygdali]|uniref:uncharacterized protein n=1 Tax=Phomopsis amygdali TaxID=1214568 RepID=UPI0022FEC2C4